MNTIAAGLSNAHAALVAGRVESADHIIAALLAEYGAKAVRKAADKRRADTTGGSHA